MIRENLNPTVEIRGILPTMYDGRTLHSKEAVEMLKENFGELVFETRIRKTVRYAEAPVQGSSVLKYDPAGAPPRRIATSRRRCSMARRRASMREARSPSSSGRPRRRSASPRRKGSPLLRGLIPTQQSSRRRRSPSPSSSSSRPRLRWRRPRSWSRPRRRLRPPRQPPRAPRRPGATSRAPVCCARLREPRHPARARRLIEPTSAHAHDPAPRLRRLPRGHPASSGSAAPA